MFSSLHEAYGTLISSHWEKQENPQAYTDLPSQLVHPEPRRHLLGFVGGNDVSLIQGNLVDLESDLKGIHFLNTFCPSRQYQPENGNELVRENVKQSIRIDIKKSHLPTYQMISYPAVMAPLPIVNEVCQKPEKY
jgi:hypothetical protein